MDLDDCNTAVLFGDGAGAVVMGRVSEGRGILSFELGADEQVQNIYIKMSISL